MSKQLEHVITDVL